MIEDRIRGALLRERARAHLSLRTLATSIGVDHATVSRFLRGREADGHSLDLYWAWLHRRGLA